jgi:hypothetical protein
MTDVSTFRLYLMRATYLLVAGGLALNIWPRIIDHPAPWSFWHGVAYSMLGTVSILAAFGLRYPLQMLPVMFFELIWKSIWLVVVGLPLWSAGQMDADNLATAQECLMGVIFLVVIPWRYVLHNYLLRSGDRWW